MLAYKRFLVCYMINVPLVTVGLKVQSEYLGYLSYCASEVAWKSKITSGDIMFSQHARLKITISY